MLIKVGSTLGFLLVVFLLSVGLTSGAQGVATALVFALLCAAIFSVAKDQRLAVSVIFARVVVVVIAVLYIQPFLEAETGTDAQMYHAVGIQIAHSILTSGAIPSSGEVWGTNFYAIFTGVYYALFGTSQLGIMLFNSMLAATGSLLIYQTFVENYGRPHWTLKYLIIFDPSVLYWSSIHGKDPSVFFFLGVLFRSLSRLFRSGGYKWLVPYFLALGWMFAIRPQVAFVCASAALATLLILRLRAPFPSPAIKLCFRLSAAAVSVSALVLFVFYGSIGGDSVEGLLPKLSAVVHGLSFGGTAIDIPIFSTWTDLIAYLPYGAIVVLFRPFPWEEGNTFIRLAGIHQLLLTSSFLLIAWGMIKRFKVGRALGSKAAKLASLDPLTVFLLAYCLAFVFLYAVISGNVGTLVREKIQVAPFAWCAAFALNSFLRVPLRWPRRVNQLAMGGAIHEF